MSNNTPNYKETSKEPGLWIPRKILSKQDMTLSDKAFYSYFRNFKDGCWQSNEQLSKWFGVTDRTIRRYITKLENLALLEVENRDNRYRKIWAKDPKKPEHGQGCPRSNNPDIPVRGGGHTCPGSALDNGSETAKVGHKCPPINNKKFNNQGAALTNFRKLFTDFFKPNGGRCTNDDAR